MALMVLGLLRINLWVSLVLALGRSLLQLTVLAVGVSIALEVPGWGTIGLGLFLGMIATQFTYNRLELPLDRFRVGGILFLAAMIPTLYTVVLVLRPTPIFAPQAWLPVLSLSLASASAIVLQGGNGVWQQVQRQQATNSQDSLGFDFQGAEEDSLEADPWLAEALPPDPPPEVSPLQAPNSKLKTQNSLTSLWRDVLTQTLHLRFQQITALGLISLPLVFAAQLLVDIDPLIALGYEVLLMLTSLNSGLIALWGLQQMAREVCGGLAKTNTMRRGIPRV
jgi:ABC-type iron transport system FetAB permease component